METGLLWEEKTYFKSCKAEDEIDWFWDYEESHCAWTWWPRREFSKKKSESSQCPYNNKLLKAMTRSFQLVLNVLRDLYKVEIREQHYLFCILKLRWGCSSQPQNLLHICLASSMVLHHVSYLWDISHRFTSSRGKLAMELAHDAF